MKKILIILVLCASVFIVTPLYSQSDERIELVIWAEPGMASCFIDPESAWEFCNYTRALNDSFEAQYPNIDLIWEDHGWDNDLYINLLEAIESGNAPDITVGESFMPRLVALDHLRPLNLEPELRENLIPATISAVERDGQIYGVAAFTAIFTLEINGDVFLLAGLDPSSVDLSTWDHITDMAKTITETGNGDFYGISILGPTNWPAAALFRVMPYLYQMDAPLCNMPDCDTPSFNHPNAAVVYEWFDELNQYTPPGVTFNGDEAFVFTQLFAGNVAMQTAGSWHPSWAEASGCLDCRYFPLPVHRDGHRANVVVGNAIYSIMANTEYPEEAQRFLEWLLRDDIQSSLFWTGVGGRLPTTFTGIQLLIDVIQGDTASVPLFYSEVLGRDLTYAPLEAARFSVFIDELLNGEVHILPPWANNFTAMNLLWNEMFAEILTSDSPVQDILDEYQARAEDLIAE